MNEHIIKALDVIEDGLIIINRDYIIEYANEPSKKLLRQENLVGRHSYEAIWGRESLMGKSPTFMTFDTKEIAGAERTFEDGTCLYVRAHPLDEDHTVLTIWDVTSYVSLENRLKKAGTDPVTGLRNSDSFREELEKELDRSKRARATLSLMLVELGSLENDTEEVRDKRLKKSAEIVIDTARSYDMIFRLRGDCFAILMPHCIEDAAKKTGERMLERIHKAIGDNIDVSIGISGSGSAFTGRDVIRLAERALYVAKHKGGNICVIG